MYNKVTQRLLKKKKYIVSAVARNSSEQVRLRQVRKRLSQVYALIYPGVALLGGDATAAGGPLQWGWTTVGMTGIVPLSRDATWVGMPYCGNGNNSMI